LLHVLSWTALSVFDEANVTKVFPKIVEMNPKIDNVWYLNVCFLLKVILKHANSRTKRRNDEDNAGMNRHKAYRSSHKFVKFTAESLYKCVI
jgi:hypothetical protein